MIPAKTLQLAALAIVFEFAAGVSAQAGVPLGLYALIGSLGGFFFIWAVAHWILFNRNARYDLGRLREIHESGGGIDDELPEIEEDAGVLCPGCGEPYAAWLLVCPRCKRGPGPS